LLYQRPRSQKLADRNDVQPDGSAAVRACGFRKPAKALFKTAGILAVTEGLIKEMRQQDEKQKPKSEAVKKVHA
jgi:hypothetical protein